MAKVKSKWVCTECGYETAGYLGKCPECGSYLVEKGTKKVRIACSNSVCGYSIEKNDDEKTEE